MRVTEGIRHGSPSQWPTGTSILWWVPFFCQTCWILLTLGQRWGSQTVGPKRVRLLRTATAYEVPAAPRIWARLRYRLPAPSFPSFPRKVHPLLKRCILVIDTQMSLPGHAFRGTPCNSRSWDQIGGWGQTRENPATASESCFPILLTLLSSC